MHVRFWVFESTFGMPYLGSASSSMWWALGQWVSLVVDGCEVSGPRRNTFSSIPTALLLGY